MENNLELDSSDFEEDQYSRLRLIPWWDQERLTNAMIMVVGAGAIGNELIKNLSLLGIGKILVYDMDSIENTNLTRSVLYRRKDVGRFKAEVAREIRACAAVAAGEYTVALTKESQVTESHAPHSLVRLNI